jgi:probable rRNA maturation factor
MNIEIVHAHPAMQDEQTDLSIRRCAEAVLAHLHIDTPMEVAVMLVDDETIRETNRETRQIDAPTDVLSFPMLEADPDDLASSLEVESGDIDPETGAVMLGDIVISLDAVARQAEEYGHSKDRELGYLIVHGVLHLLGYDHKRDVDKKKMRGVEDAVMDTLGLGR